MNAFRRHWLIASLAVFGLLGFAGAELFIAPIIAAVIGALVAYTYEFYRGIRDGWSASDPHDAKAQ